MIERIAVIGSGISGLSAAWLLSGRHDVTLYESDGRLGGHTNTRTVMTRQGAVAVDRVLSVDHPDVWAAWFSRRVGVPLEFERRNASTAERGELDPTTREALVAHFAPEYDVWRRLEATGEWSGARGTRLESPLQ